MWFAARLNSPKCVFGFMFSVFFVSYYTFTARSFLLTAAIWAGPVPQQPPITFTPAECIFVTAIYTSFEISPSICLINACVCSSQPTTSSALKLVKSA